MVRIHPGLPASFDRLKKGCWKKDAKLEADKEEMQYKRRKKEYGSSSLSVEMW